MKRIYKNRFIEDNYATAKKIYSNALSGAVSTWDYVAVTASSEAQAKCYREQINYRLANGLVPCGARYIVVSDPDGKRVGSGGACLNVLYEIARLEAEKRGTDKPLFAGLRILCIHSGGDSKRVPQYSVGGKLFAPMPRRMKNGLPSTLFDEIMLTVSVFPSRMSEGMLTCSGDVLLLFDPCETEYFTGGAAAISIKTDAEVGCNHGVYLADKKGRVRRFLHKQSEAVLCSEGAVDGDGNVDIDTGAVIFDSEVLRRLYSLVDTEEKLYSAVNERVRLSFYADFSYPLSSEATLEGYLCEKPEGEFTPELKRYRALLWKLLSGVNMRVTSFSPAEFLHFGTTAELRGLMTERMPSFCNESWKRFVNTESRLPYYVEKRVSVNSSVIAKDAVIRQGSYIEDSYVGSSETGEGCVISRSVIPDGAVIPRDTVVSTVKLPTGYVARVYGVYDDPKERLHLGKPIGEPLWSARLFPVRPSPSEAVAASLALYFGDGYADDKSERYESLESSFLQAVGGSPLREREEIMLTNIKKEFAESAEEISSVYDVARVPEGLDGDTVENVIPALVSLKTELVEQEPHKLLRNMRLNGYLYALTRENGYLDAAFDYLKRVIVGEETGSLYGKRPVCDEKSVSLPVRVNFGGGWTDTPPFCIERGGTVLNAAVILGNSLQNTGFPVNATVRRIAEKKLVLISDESGERTEIYADTPAELTERCLPSEPFAIHKAALLACGLLSDGGDARTLFDITGGGLELYTAVRGIPKGSGLGTSSILSGALLSAIYGLFGVEAENDVIFRKVLIMEQYMGTGGGWQDQVGGMTSGIKLITSVAGARQKPVVTQIGISEETLSELEERFVLIYTGQRRESKNILREVVWRYIAARDGTVPLLCDIGDIPYFMSERLEKGDVDGFARMLTQAYERTEQLYRGCFNCCTDEIFSAVGELICGKMICGAGGGGYLQAVLKKGVSFEALQTRLYDVFGECEIKAQKCRFVRDLPR